MAAERFFAQRVANQTEQSVEPLPHISGAWSDEDAGGRRESKHIYASSSQPISTRRPLPRTTATAPLPAGAVAADWMSISTRGAPAAHTRRR